MKRIIYIILLIIITSNNINACEICGCGGSNTYLGLLPDFKTKFIGIRYNHQYYKTVMEMDKTQFSHNYYNTTEIWGGVNVGKKWKMLAFVPYKFNKQAGDDDTTYNSGFGDITVLANYKLWNKVSVNGNKGVSQQLWIGGGFKLPVGKFGVNAKDPATAIADINAQLGTGTIDFLFNVLYNVKFGNWGVNTTMNYKANTDNDGYKFGDKLSANSIGYYRIACKNGNYVSPNIGVMYENTATNTLSGVSVASTGGYLASGSAGVEWNIKKIAFGINAALPISQNYAQGQTTLSWKGNSHITVAL
ncbi:MAG: hypothetical protein WCP65_01115 [Bacteroidota bacterium]